ncbi:MAG: hypothetical protein IJL48_05845 [Bacteroidales bacterium]|nr:hypothetical protein [Bacteroidales bacterium]
MPHKVHPRSPRHDTTPPHTTPQYDATDIPTAYTTTNPPSVCSEPDRVNTHSVHDSVRTALE